MPEFLPGHVWLVGAGPGDPGLLTLNAVHALQHADVIVYDALVDEACLSFAASSAVLEYAGKRGGKPSPKQRDISLRLVDLAREGKKVLRLKGGDPFVFGRGAEEALNLAAHDIPFRIVPGVTAGIGGLAYAGIPATHRDTNHCVTFLTGHDAGGLVPSAVDWESVAKGSPVLVMYMAVKHIAPIAEKLLAAGRLSHEPLAFVSRAATPTQQVIQSTLGSAAADAEKHDVKAPAIVVLGDVVTLREGLDWWGALTEGKSLNPDPLGSRLKDEAV